MVSAKHSLSHCRKALIREIGERIRADFVGIRARDYATPLAQKALFDDRLGVRGTDCFRKVHEFAANEMLGRAANR
jgi:hypothetical protein